MRNVFISLSIVLLIVMVSTGCSNTTSDMIPGLSQNSGWQKAGVIASSATGSSWNARVAFDTGGTAYVAWVYYTTVNTIYASRFNSLGRWSSGKNIGSNLNGSICLAGGAPGQALATWPYKTADPTYGINAAFYDGSWNVAASMTATAMNNDLDDATMDVTGDGTGNFIAIWRAYSGTRYRVYVSHYNGGTETWSAPVPIDDDAQEARWPRIAMNASG